RSRAKSCVSPKAGWRGCGGCVRSRTASSATTSSSTSPASAARPPVAAMSSSSIDEIRDGIAMTHSAQSGPSPAKRPIRVLIVDDSALVRSLLTSILRTDPGIEVVGVAGDAHVAREKIKLLQPDVLTLDVEMPRMDGITFLRNLMRLRPMPVVMVSSLTERGADVTLDALALGAVDYLSKPKIDLAATLKDYAEELIEKVRIAARASVRALDPRRAATITVKAAH